MKKALFLAVILVFEIYGVADAFPIGSQIKDIGSWSMESQRYLAKKVTYRPLDHIDLFADTWEGFPNYPSTSSLGSIQCQEEPAPVSKIATMIFLGVALIGLSKFGKKILNSG